MNDRNYITAFNDLAKELLHQPEIELLGYHTFGGLTTPKIEALEQKYNCQLDDAMRSFYSQSNGLQIRWIFKNNPSYNPQKYPPMQRNTAPVGWDYAVDTFNKEDGCLLILPLEEVLRKFVPPDIYQEDISFEGRTYSNIDFYSRLRPFDSFSYYCNMALLLSEDEAPFVLMGDEQGSCFVDSKRTNFETYLHFLIASKGLCQRRKEFFGQANGFKEPMIKTISPGLEKQWSLDMLLLVQDFPLADQSGSSTQHIETEKMQAKASAQTALQASEFEQIIVEHQQFLNSGGTGGEWQIIAIQGRALGVYKGKQHKEGKQAILDMRKFTPALILHQLQLPYSSWCGVFAEDQDFSEADLLGSIMTDANFEQASFSDANLENVDFSRSNLKGASFLNANLSGADFENCNLEGADFRGAIMDGSQFKGAVLKDVRR